MIRALLLGLVSASVSELDDDEEAGDNFLLLRPGTPGFTEVGMEMGEVLVTPVTVGIW